MNTQEIHQRFSGECFNQTWGLMDQPERGVEEVRKMMATSHASLFHWLNRDDCTPTNLSIGLWQLSRVYVLSDSALEAMRYGKDCLDVSETNDLSAFCIAYAHEAVSRAALLGGDVELAKSHLDLATQCAEGITDAEDRRLIDADLGDLGKRLS